MKVFSFDAETNGLYGQAFMLAAIVTTAEGLVAQFLARCPIEGEVNSWVAENVLLNVTDVAVTHESYSSMLEAFYAFYMENKGADVIAHMPYPVEAKVLRDMVEVDLEARGWNGPYPLIDVAGILKAKNLDPTSVDTYNKNNGLIIPFSGVTHHPLYDSWAAEVAYRHLMK
jgi:hypothetical protein